MCVNLVWAKGSPRSVSIPVSKLEPTDKSASACCICRFGERPRRPTPSTSVPAPHSVRGRPQIWRQSRPNRAASRTLWSSTRARPPAATVRQRTPLSSFFKVPDCPLPYAFASPRSLHHHRAHRDRRPQGRARHLDDDRLGRQGQRRQPASRGPRGGAR